MHEASDQLGTNSPIQYDYIIIRIIKNNCIILQIKQIKEILLLLYCKIKYKY